MYEREHLKALNIATLLKVTVVAVY